MRVVFVKDPAELERLATAGFAHAGDFLFPLMPKAALAIHSARGDLPRLAVDYLDPTEREAVDAESRGLSRSWHHGFSPGIVVEGVDIFECCRLQMLGFFQDLLAAEKAVPRLLAELRPNEAVFAARPRVPSCGLSIHDGTSDILSAVLQWRLAEAGVRVSVLDRRTFGVAGPLRRRAPPWLKRLIRRMRSRRACGEAAAGRVRASELAGGKPIVAGIGGGYDLMVLAPYVEAVARETGARPLLLSGEERMPPPSLRSGLALDTNTPWLWRGDLAGEGRTAALLRGPRSRCLEGLRGGTALPPQLRNPLLEFQFDLFWYGLAPEAVSEARRARAFLERFPTLALFDDYCAGVAPRAWAQVAAGRGVRTATLPHGAVNLIEFHDFLTDRALAWGELGRANWALAAGGRSDRVIVAGDPSMQSLEARFGDIGAAPGTKVLLLTGGVPQQAWTNIDIGGFLRTWDRLLALMRERPEIPFVIKTHPAVRDLGPWYRQRLAAEFVGNAVVVEDRRLEDLLPEAFFAVLVGKPGTAGTVCGLARVPFVYLDSMHGRDVPGFRVWRDENGVPRLTDPARLGDLIDALRRDSQARERLIAENRRFLGLSLQPFAPRELARALGLGIDLKERAS